MCVFLLPIVQNPRNIARLWVGLQREESQGLLAVLSELQSLSAS